MIVLSPHPVSLELTVRSHGWARLAPWIWNPNAGELRRVELLPDGSRTEVTVRQQAPDRFGSSWQPEVSTAGCEQVLAQRIRRWLSLDWDPYPAIEVAQSLDPHLARYLLAGGGRFLRGSTFYEDFVKTLVTINASWPFTVQMVQRLVTDLGNGAFPGPVDVLQAGPDYLREHIRVGFRAPVIHRATEALLRRGWLDESGEAIKEPAAADLLELNGVGPYAASHVRMLLHDHSRLPIDSEVKRYCREVLGLRSEEIESHFDAWGEHRFLGYKLARIIRRDSWSG